MGNKTVYFYLSSSVADGGTFSVSYPDGYTDGDFELSAGNFAMIGGKKLMQPADIGLSFGDTSVTVTNRTGGTLPANAGGYFNFKTFDTANRIFSSADNGAVAQKRIPGDDLHAITVNFGSPLTADTDGICASQSVDVSEADALINGALASGGAVTLEAYGRNVVAAWTGAAVLIVQGYDYYGQEMEERRASGTSFTGVKAFKRVTRVTWTSDVTGATVGTGDVLGLPVRVPSANHVLAEWQDNVMRPLRAGNVRIDYGFTATEMDTPTTRYLVPGFAGTIVRAGTVQEGTTTTGGNITFTVGATAVDGLTLTVANGATAGTLTTDTPTAGHASTAFAATDYVTVVPGSAFASSAGTRGFIEVQPTSRLDGTFVAGLAKNTEATTTNADVRGTYDPFTACDGTTSFALTLLVPQSDDIGNPQYSA